MSRLVYEFKCKHCDRRYELFERETDQTCCNDKLNRVYSIGDIQFKGVGFYSTDSKFEP